MFPARVLALSPILPRLFWANQAALNPFLRRPLLNLKHMPSWRAPGDTRLWSRGNHINLTTKRPTVAGRHDVDMMAKEAEAGVLDNVH